MGWELSAEGVGGGGGCACPALESSVGLAGLGEFFEGEGAQEAGEVPAGFAYEVGDW